MRKDTREEAEGTEGERIRQIQHQATKVAHHATPTGRKDAGNGEGRSASQKK